MGQGPLHEAAAQGPRGVPVTTAMGLPMGTASGKEKPWLLHQAGRNHKPPRANSSPESGRGHCSTKELFSP